MVGGACGVIIIIIGNGHSDWLVGCFTTSTLFESFNAELKFQTIQFSLSIVFVYKQLNVKIVLFQTIQFSISTQFKV